MSLVSRLILAFAAVAVTSVAITGLLSYREAADRIPRALAEPGVLRDTSGSQAGGPAAGTPAGSVAMGLGARGQEVFLEQLQRALLYAGVVALAVALVVGGAVATRVTQPIQRLTRVTRRYGAGEREVRANLRGTDEIAELGQVFDDAADRLAAEQELKQRFTTDVAHELRTPITVLKSELEAMQDGLMDASPERVEGLLEQVDVLARLVSDLRTLTLAEAGALPMNREPVDLGALASSTLASFRGAASEVQLTLDAPSNPVTVSGDPVRLRQVLGNLLANAIRHTPSGGRVNIHVAQTPGEGVTLSVHNEGEGIPEEDLPYLFERFYRVDAARARDEGGSGVGLAIVKALAEAHGASVGVSNAAAGGVRVTVAFPEKPVS